MPIYDIDGNILSGEQSGGILCYNRNYTYENPLLLCEQKDLNSNGSLTNSTTRCVIHLPKHGAVEVRTQRLTGMFKVARVSGTTVTWLDTDWSYYYTRYIGDGSSSYYAVVALTPDGTGTITPDMALDKIAVYSYFDVGSRSSVSSSLNGKTVAFIGDSITQGRFRKMASSSLTWTATKPFGSLVAEIANDMDYGNYGIGGALVTTVLTPWESLVTNCGKVQGYDVVFICGGTNDYGNNAPQSDFTTAYQTVVDTLKANNTEVVACTPVYRTSKTGKNRVGLTLQDYCNLIKSISAASGIKCIDLYSLTNDGVFITFCPDGLHPNEIGHKIMADLIVEQYDALHE